MKQNIIYLSVICIALSMILICVPVMAEGEGGGDGSGMGGGGNTDIASVSSGLLSLQYILGGLVALAGLILLKTTKINWNIRILLMCAVFILFGVLVVMHQPSPLRTVVDPVTALIIGSTITIKKITALIFIGSLSVIGAKLFCGWVCPFGALQEIINRIPAPTGKKIKLPFNISNSIRISIFSISLIMVLATGSDLYTYHNILNPFELFDWHFELVLSVLVGTILIASLFVYRPFCYLVCPVGLLSWLLEHISIFRVRIIQDLCNNCNKCIRVAPCPSVKAIVNGDTLQPDCFACGVCIDACPTDALKFGIRKPRYKQNKSDK
ncbi:MAG: 4Fe-4S binding protein [Methanosarcinales archaeon]|nr:MAG: 4Fe-4S binding protein [Methanosarcinales archaeon]